MSKKIKVFIAAPTTGDVFDVHAHMLRGIEAANKDTLEFYYPPVLVRRIFHDFARNEMVREFLSTDCDVMWFLDSDVAPPLEIAEVLTKHYHRWKVAGAPYPVFMTPPGDKIPHVLFTVYHLIEGKHVPASIPPSGLDYVDSIATGCMFIKREVFKDLKEPYFEFKYREDNRQMTEGEDLGFCKKLNKLGYRFFINYAHVCKHYKKVCLMDVNNYAVEYANKSVMAFDREIRPQIEALQNAVREKMNPKGSKKQTNIISPFSG